MVIVETIYKWYAGNWQEYPFDPIALVFVNSGYFQYSTQKNKY